MVQEDVAATMVVEKSVTFTAYKRQLIVDAQKVGDAVAFYKAVFDAVETGHSLYPKRKADHQELPHLVSSELTLAGTTVVVSDVSVNSGSHDAKKTMPVILETDDVEAAVGKAVTAGAVAEVEADGGATGRVTDPYGFTWIFVSPANESEKDGRCNKEAREEAYDELLPQGFSEEWVGCFNDLDTPTLPEDLECLDQYTSKWYSDCFNDTVTPTLPLSFGSPEVQVFGAECLTPDTETWEVRRPVTRSSANVIFKDMTIKDINQKIQTLAAKPKEDKAEPPVIQTSAFSGKPVVGKTRFHRERGKGSITVMRTRG